jgi:hypothetical protein
MEPYRAIVRVIVMADSTEEAYRLINEALATNDKVATSYIIGAGRGNLTEDEQDAVDAYNKP